MRIPLSFPTPNRAMETLTVGSTSVSRRQIFVALWNDEQKSKIQQTPLQIADKLETSLASLATRKEANYQGKDREPWKK